MQLLIARFWREGLILILVGVCLWYRGEAISGQADAKVATNAYNHLAGVVKEQNSEVQRLEADSKARQAATANALALARSEGEARRVRSNTIERSMATVVADSECPAGDAVSEYREILRKGFAQ